MRAERNEQLKIVQKELDFYQELGHSKEKYEKLRELKKLEKDINQTIKNLVSERDRKETEKDELDRTTTNMKRKIDSTNRQIEDNESEINGLKNQLQRNEDKLETTKNELVTVLQDLQGLENYVPNLFAELTAHFAEGTSLSEEALKKLLQNGKIVFQGALTEENINPAAKDNYQKAKGEYEQLEQEYKQSKILLKLTRKEQKS